jgi:hypothetical protein
MELAKIAQKIRVPIIMGFSFTFVLCLCSRLYVPSTLRSNPVFKLCTKKRHAV